MRSRSSTKDKALEQQLKVHVSQQSQAYSWFYSQFQFPQVIHSCCATCLFCIDSWEWPHQLFIKHHSNSNSVSVHAFVSVDKQLNQMQPQDPVASRKIFHQQCVPLYVRRCSLKRLDVPAPLNPILSNLNSSPTIHAAQNQNYHEITQSLRWQIGKCSCNTRKRKIRSHLYKLNSSNSVTGVGSKNTKL